MLFLIYHDNYILILIYIVHRHSKKYVGSYGNYKNLFVNF